MGEESSERSGAPKCLSSYVLARRNSPPPREERMKDWIAQGESWAQGAQGALSAQKSLIYGFATRNSKRAGVRRAASR